MTAVLFDGLLLVFLVVIIALTIGWLIDKSRGR